MLIPWESNKQIVAGDLAAAYHDVEGKFHVIYTPEGTRQPHLISAEVPLGIWDNLTFTEPVAIAPDNNLVSINIFNQPDDNVWIVWETDKQHRLSILPDTGEIYDPESVYRLYYAVDTEKLYMNISETWQFIGSPNIQQLIGYQEVLDGAPIYDDTELKQRLEALELVPAPVPYDDGALIARLEALEANPPGTYDDSVIQQAIVDLDTRLDTLEAGSPPVDTRSTFAQVANYAAYAGKATQEEIDNFIDVVHATSQIFKVITIDTTYWYVFASDGSTLDVDTTTKQITSNGTMYSIEPNNLDRNRGTSVDWSTQGTVVVHETYIR